MMDKNGFYVLEKLTGELMLGLWKNVIFGFALLIEVFPGLFIV